MSLQPTAIALALEGDGLDWPTMRVAHKDGEFQVLWPGELAGPFKRSGWEIQDYAPAPQPQVREKQLEEALKEIVARGDRLPGGNYRFAADLLPIARTALEGKETS